MELKSEQIEGVSVVSIRGNVDALTAGEVQRYLDGLVANKVVKLTVDLSGVDFMSSAGLRVILSVSKSVRRQGGDLRLAAPKPPIEKMLKISGFTSIMKSFPSVNAAVGSFQ